MLLLVGLGNPGPSYARNRHNVGFMALDRVVERHSFPSFRKRFHGLFAEGKVDRRRVMALKPLTYMNDSGRAVGEAVRFHRLSPADVFVLHDEIDLAPGKVRVKQGGGSAGHNGLRSIDSDIGPDFWRVRSGLGRPVLLARTAARDDLGVVPEVFLPVGERARAPPRQPKPPRPAARATAGPISPP